jgi:ribonuclease E
MSEENKKTTPKEPDSSPKSTKKTQKTDKPAKPAAKKSKPRPRKPAPKKSAPKKTTIAKQADTPAKPETTAKKDDTKAKQPAKASAAARKPRPRKPAPKKSAPKKTITAEATDAPIKPKTSEKKDDTKAKQPAKASAAARKPRPRKPAPKKSAPKKTVTAEATDAPTKPETTAKKDDNKAKQPAKASAAARKPRPRKPAPKKSAPKKTITAEATDAPTQPESAEKKDDSKVTQPAKASAASRKPRPRKPAPRKSTPKKTITAEAIDTPAKPEIAEQKEEAKQPAKASATEKREEHKPPVKSSAVARKPHPRKPSPQKSLPKAETTQKESTNIKLLINADDPEEARIALIENGKVESFHIETVSVAQAKSNIYKGRIASIEPNLQTVFVEMGTEKNGFLPFSEIHPEYYCKEVPPGTHWKRLNIQEVLKKGQEVLVQVVKEATGNKGASVTTYLSMPARYVVLMPGSDSHGISRQITDQSRRSKLREIMESVKLPEEIGYIVRTASKDITKAAMVKDIHFQLNLWKEIKKRGQTMPTPSLIYKEQNVTSRFLRDHFSHEITEILVDNQETYTQIKNFLDLLPVKQQNTRIKLHKGARPIFNLYQIEHQIETMFQPEVQLPSGGSIVINPTEALVAIDVNSGRTSKDKNFEETIFLANMEAAEELARQLRLRDLGGLIVVDFIDMRDKKHIREVENKVKNAMKRDKAKKDTSRISKFGLMQISRQRLGPPIQKGSYVVCQHCQGLGMTRSVETMAIAHLRKIQTGAIKRTTDKVTCRFPLTVAQYLLNQKRADILNLERKYRVHIQIEADPAMNPSEAKIEFQQNENSEER